MARLLPARLPTENASKLGSLGSAGTLQRRREAAARRCHRPPNAEGPNSRWRRLGPAAHGAPRPRQHFPPATGPGPSRLQAFWHPLVVIGGGAAAAGALGKAWHWELCPRSALRSLGLVAEQGFQIKGRRETQGWGGSRAFNLCSVPGCTASSSRSWVQRRLER